MIDKLPDGLVVEEIHKIRRAIHDRFGGDLKAILADARNRQSQTSRPVWQGPYADPPSGKNLERRKPQ